MDLKLKLTNEFKNEYELKFANYKFTLDDAINNTLENIQLDASKDEIKALIETLIKNRKYKKYRLSDKVLKNCSIERGIYDNRITERAISLSDSLYKKNEDSFYSLYPECLGSKDILSSLKIILYKNIITWRNDRTSYIKDFPYIDSLVTQNKLYKIFTEDMLFFSYKYMLNSYFNVVSIPASFSDIPKSPTNRHTKKTDDYKFETIETPIIKVDFMHDSIDTAKEILERSKYLIPMEKGKRLNALSLNKRVVDGLKEIMRKSFSQSHVDAMTFITNTRNLFNPKEDVIRFPLDDLVKYIYKDINEKNTVATQLLLIYLASLKINKYEKISEESPLVQGFTLGFLGSLTFYFNLNNELIVATTIDGFLKEQLIQSKVIKLDGAARDKLSNKLSKALLIPLQTLRLKMYFMSLSEENIEESSYVKYIDKNTVLIPLSWFSSLCITSDKPSVLFKKLKVVFQEYKEQGILIKSFSPKMPSFEVSFKDMTEEELDRFNYTLDTKKEFLSALNSNLY